MLLHNVELNIFLLILLLFLFYMRYTPSNDVRNQNQTIKERVHSLIHESFTIAQNMQ